VKLSSHVTWGSCWPSSAKKASTAPSGITFAGCPFPHRPEPRADLDLGSFGLVKVIEAPSAEKQAFVLEPKEAFWALAAALPAGGLPVKRLRRSLAWLAISSLTGAAFLKERLACEVSDRAVAGGCRLLLFRAGGRRRLMGSLIDELQRREAAARAEAEELRGVTVEEVSGNMKDHRRTDCLAVPVNPCSRARSLRRDTHRAARRAA
jgi:hypothetical protein